MIYNLIIGKDSNLSTKLEAYLDNVILISSREILKNKTILDKYKELKINIIFNNFKTATKLNEFTSPVEYIESSILTTSIVLESFKKSNINKIIYTSSSSVYGNNIHCNEYDILNPLNLHATLKLSNEKMIEKFSQTNNIDYTIARIFNMYGGIDKFSIIQKIIDSVRNESLLTIVNNGNAIRDFIHIDDVVKIYTKILKTTNVPILNLGTGKGVSIKFIIDLIKSNKFKINTTTISREELKISTSDIQLLTQVIGIDNFLDVEDYVLKELKK